MSDNSTSQLHVPTDFHEWCATLPENARKRLSIHELRQIWEPMREGLKLVMPYLDANGVFHRHNGVDFPHAEHCPYCEVEELRAENARLKEQLFDLTDGDATPNACACRFDEDGNALHECERHTRLREQLAERTRERDRYFLSDTRIRVERNQLSRSVRRLEQERDAALARLEWQPIETAPKDREIILCRIASGEDSRVTEGYWDAPKHGRYLGDCGGECRCPEYDAPPDPYWFSADGGFTDEHPPTHWQDKPAPPADEHKAGGEG